MRTGPLVGIVLVAAVNLGIAATVVYDRAGEPDMVLMLDERELPMADDARDDNSAVQLVWRFQAAAPSRDTREPGLPVALGPSQLAALGFDVSVRPGDPVAARFYAAVPGRPAYVVFDTADAAVRPRIAEWQARARAEVREGITTSVPGDTPAEAGDTAAEEAPFDESFVAAAPARASRLVPIDAAPDAAALRARYPDRQRYLILSTVVRLRLFDPDARAGGPALYGEIGLVLPSRLLVPHASRQAFDQLRPSPGRPQRPAPAGGITLAQSPWPPRYRVELIVGRRYRPRIGRVDVILPPPGHSAGTTGPG